MKGTPRKATKGQALPVQHLPNSTRILCEFQVLSHSAYGETKMHRVKEPAQGHVTSK